MKIAGSKVSHGNFADAIDRQPRRVTHSKWLTLEGPPRRKVDHRLLTLMHPWVRCGGDKGEKGCASAPPPKIRFLFFPSTPGLPGPLRLYGSTNLTTNIKHHNDTPPSLKKIRRRPFLLVVAFRAPFSLPLAIPVPLHPRDKEQGKEPSGWCFMVFLIFVRHKETPTRQLSYNRIAWAGKLAPSHN